MERHQKMTTFRAKPGFALPAVLFIAVLGILIGFGRLLMFNYQCRLRIDRQHDFEKVFAVRSALNRLQNWSSNPSFPTEGGKDERIVFRTNSGRTVKVIVHPADVIFPIEGNARHFCVGREKSKKDDELHSAKFSRIAGYRYVSSANGDTGLKCEWESGFAKSVYIMPTNAVPNQKCRLSLDMADTGRWSDDPYGRRYAFNVEEFCGGTNLHDTVRFVLRRKRMGESFGGDGKGFTEGAWRPSVDNESVIYAELSTGGGNDGYFQARVQSMADGGLKDWNGWNVTGIVSNQISSAGIGSAFIYGIQLVGPRLTLFRGSSTFGGLFKQYDFFGTADIPPAVYFDFTNNVTAALSPDMVMELEVVASPSRDANQFLQENRFNKFEVYPAFEYEILVESQNEGERIAKNLATVVHLDIDTTRNSKCTAISYDTHGTENPGFRKDEREADRKRTGR